MHKTEQKSLSLNLSKSLAVQGQVFSGSSPPVPLEPCQGTVHSALAEQSTYHSLGTAPAPQAAASCLGQLFFASEPGQEA